MAIMYILKYSKQRDRVMIEKIKRIGILRNLSMIISIVVVILAIYGMISQNVIIDKVLFPLCWHAICLNWIAELIDCMRLRKELTEDIFKKLRWQRVVFRIKAIIRFEVQLPEEAKKEIMKIFDDEIKNTLKEIKDATVRDS